MRNQDQERRRQSVKRFAFINGIPVAIFVAIVNYAGDAVKAATAAAGAMQEIRVDVQQVREKTAAIMVDVAVIKSELAQLQKVQDPRGNNQRGQR